MLQSSALTRDLPANIQILTLEPWNAENTILLRLENVFEKDEHPTLSKSTTISLDVININLYLSYYAPI